MPRWIDMRAENRALIHGDRRTIAQGYWAVLRIFRHGEYSKYWDPNTQQAVGGPKYNYDDFVIRVIGRPGSGTGSQSGLSGQGTGSILNTGNDDLDSKSFAIVPDYPGTRPFTREPNNGDIIFEINKHDGVDVPIPPYVATDRYLFTNVIHERGDNGRDEIYYAIGKRIHGEF